MDDHELRALLGEIRGAVRSLALGFPPQEFDDLVSVGMIGAWRAITAGTLEPRRLIVKARWAMQDYLRLIKPGRRRGAPEVVFSFDAMSALTFRHFEPADPTPSAEERLAELRTKRAQAKALAAALRSLSPRMRFVVKRRLAGWNNASIAKKLGVTEARVSQMWLYATKQIRLKLLGSRP